MVLEEKKAKKARKHGAEAPFVLGVLYDTGLPMGNTADFNKKFNGRGFSIDARYRGFKPLRVGGSFSYIDFQEKRDSTFEYGNATLGGMQVRETAASTLTGYVGVAWDKGKRVIPYLRVGIGPSRVWRRVDVGVSRFISESWHFAVVPELGVELPLRRCMILIAARYNFIAAGGDTPTQSFMNFSAGVGFE